MTAGSEITPRGDTRLRWLQARLQGGAGIKFRDAAYAVLRTREPGTALHDELIESLHLMTDEVERWKDAWASEHVDKDRQVRRAMAESANCEHHGVVIKDLEAQVAHYEEQAARNEAARLVLLGWYDACGRFLEGCERSRVTNGHYPPMNHVLDWLRTSLPKVHRAHQNAWHKPTTRKDTPTGDDKG
jgi:hypothetical protein